MRVAAIYDIHANLPALEAVLQDIRQAEVDQIVVGGDVLPGPMPNETIECLLNLDIPVQLIQGNGDRVVLAQMRSTESSEVPEQFREVVRWVARQLHPEHERLLASWPKKCRVEIRGLSVFERRSIHKLRSLQQGMSCNPHPRKKHWKHLPESN